MEEKKMEEKKMEAKKMEAKKFFKYLHAEYKFESYEEYHEGYESVDKISVIFNEEIKDYREDRCIAYDKDFLLFLNELIRYYKKIRGFNV